MFVGHFCPPGSGSRDPTESGSDPDPQHLFLVQQIVLNKWHRRLSFAGIVVGAQGLAKAVPQLAHGDGNINNALRGAGHPVGEGVVLFLNAALREEFLEALAARLARGQQQHPGRRLVQPGQSSP